MKALVLVEFGKLEIENRDDPSPQPGEVIVEIIATGICGSDLHGYTGHNGRRFLGQVMGHETVGRISDVSQGGPDCHHTVGDIVTINPLLVHAEDVDEFRGREQHSPRRRVIGVQPDIVATFAQRISVPAQNVFTMSDKIPQSWGALVEPLAVALNVIRRVGVNQGDSVLVIGGGPIGQSCILAAFHAGAGRVLVSEPNAARRALCAELGAIAIDPDDGDMIGVVTAQNGALVDVSIDAVGVTSTVETALNATRFGGKVGLVGMGDPNISMSAFKVSTEERSIVGSFCYSNDGFKQAVDWVNSGDPHFAILISEEVTLEQAQNAFERLARGEDVPGKILVRLGG